MLVITRRQGESFIISRALGVDPDMKVSDLFAAGHIKITITGTVGRHVGIRIDAPETLAIVREELQRPEPDSARQKHGASHIRVLKSSSLLRSILPRALLQGIR